jgi:hypothetical protein
MDAELGRSGRAQVDAVEYDTPGRARRVSTETKASYKTTELAVYVIAVLGVLLASWLVDGTAGGDDPFNAEQAWRLVSFLTIGYMVSRGLAKSGSREPYDDRR